MTHPQINAVKFRDTFKQAFKANPTPQTALLITKMLQEMASGLNSQAELISAPANVRVAIYRLRERLTGLEDDIDRIQTGAIAAIGKSYQEAMAEVEVNLFSGYAHGSAPIEDDWGSYDPGKLRGDVWETATLYNQVGAIDNPMNTTYFGDGFAAWIGKAMTQAIVATSQAMGDSDALNDAVDKWQDFKTYVSTQTDQLAKKASGWMWVAVALAAALAYREYSKGGGSE